MYARSLFLDHGRPSGWGFANYHHHLRSEHLSLTDAPSKFYLSYTCLGWYVVKLDAGKTIADYNTTAKKVIANASGCPDPNLFVRAPFSESMTFSTIIAEQANLAGFLFRNQVLYSQTGAKTSSCHPTPNTQLANLSLDGFNGVIRFLDRMVLDSSGITLKDNCGKPRMQFQWTLEGTPRLRFLNENGETTWEAGNNGYIAYFQSRPTTYTEITGEFISGVSIGTTPTATQIKNGVNHNIIGNIVCKCGSNYNGFSTYAANNPPTIGYYTSSIFFFIVLSFYSISCGSIWSNHKRTIILSTSL